MENETYKDFGMLFENIVKKIWGEPKTTIYFASYYMDKIEGMMILYALCIYILNYQSPEGELKEKMKHYISSKDIYLNHDEFMEMLKFLEKEYSII
jgi:hypothetical protein